MLPINREREENSIPNNRSGRRYTAIHGTPKGVTALQNATDDFNSILQRYNEVWVKGANDEPKSTFVYRGEPVLLDLADRAHVLAIALQGASKYKHDIVDFEKNKASEIFFRRVHGVSLCDIEQLQLPLSPDSIRTINKLTRYVGLDQYFLPGRDKTPMQIALWLPSFELARPNEITLPGQLRPLSDRLTAYYDYYAGFISSSRLDVTRFMQFGELLLFQGASIVGALASFMPARLGITPASTFKLFDERVAVDGIAGTAFMWTTMKNKVAGEIANSYRDNGLPQPLQKYQHLNTSADREAVKMFKPLYEQVTEQQAENQDQRPDVDELFKRFGKYHRALRADILSSKDGYLRLSVEHPIIREVLVTSQYRHSLVFVLLLADGQTHLTVEVNQNHRLFGIPGDLYKAIPHVANLLTSDVLTPVLGHAKAAHPEVEPVKISSVRPIPSSQIVVDPTQIEDKPQPKVKKRHLPKLFSVQEPPLPDPEIEAKPMFEVSYTRDMVQKMLGHKDSDKIVDRVTGCIDEFEWGRKQAEALTDLPNHYKIRVGDYRIIIEHYGRGKYSVREIEHRARVYRGVIRRLS